MHPIYPCLWFDNEAAEAARFYTAVFRNGKILQENPIVTSFEIGGTRFMALNGGPQYQKTPAVSYFAYCGGDAEIERIYAALTDGGSVLMPLGKYDWTEKYAWVVDRYGVSWQLDVDPINNSQTIVPALLFANEKAGCVKDAMTTYTQLFPGSRILLESPAPPALGLPEGALLFAQFKLGTFILNAMASPIAHAFDFTPGSSFVVECDTQEEIDQYWNALGEGGRYDRCGWLADKYGVSWQVIPHILPQLMADPEKGPRVVQAFLKMQKFELQALIDA